MMAITEQFRMASRRRVLAVGGLVLAGTAGCVGESATSGADRTHEATDTSATTGAGETTATDGDRLRITVTDGDEEVELVTAADVATVGERQSPERLDGYQLPVTLTDEGTEAFTDGLDHVGAFEDPERHEIRTYFGGELLYEAKLGPELADAMESGEWDGSFLLTVTDRETAAELKDALEERRTETTRE